jgi:hypothetical protein
MTSLRSLMRLNVMGKFEQKAVYEHSLS